MKKKRLKQFASVVLTLTLAVQPVIAGAQELDVPAENFDSAEVFADAKEEETEPAATETENDSEEENLEIVGEQPDLENPETLPMIFQIRKRMRCSWNLHSRLNWKSRNLQRMRQEPVYPGITRQQIQHRLSV